MQIYATAELIEARQIAIETKGMVAGYAFVTFGTQYEAQGLSHAGAFDVATKIRTANRVDPTAFGAWGGAYSCSETVALTKFKSRDTTPEEKPLSP